MDESQAERRAEERGGMKKDIEYLIEKVDDIHMVVNGLDCKQNTKKIDEMYITHLDNKEMKKHIAKTIISKVTQAFGLVAAGATAVYAYFK